VPLAAQGSAVPLRGGSLNPQSSILTPSYVPHRVFDTKHKQFIDFETLVSRLTGADFVFIGEQHDDPATHRMELALLEGIARRRDSVVLALEMFERDVQPKLDAYLGGGMSEAEFLQASRPWKNYAGDYRPLVELARVRGWPVVASDVPRPLAVMVGRAGLKALDTLEAGTRAQVAEAIACPEDRYYEKFAKVMGDLAAHGPAHVDGETSKARLGRMYQAQCLKDETMGESVARVWRPGRLVVHYNGAFHSDFRLGTAERAQRRAANASMIVVTAMPVKQLDRLKPSKLDRKRANYLLYVLAPVKADSAGR
ncbi:MAG TPA: ChaN family lipoprotein, partial [Gemmatimonadales bacterium]|nr:ChaN family lipoprotein [Gemmatimonadales bacterium]